MNTSTLPEEISPIRPRLRRLFLRRGMEACYDLTAWTAEKGVLPYHVISNVLPVQWDTDFSQSPEALAQGNDMPERDEQFLAPPVSHFFWRNGENGGWLRAFEDTPEPFDVLDFAGNSCNRDPIEGYHWSAVRPRQVQILWKLREQVI